MTPDFFLHAAVLVKQGRKEPGSAEKYLPWYGAASLGGLGSLAAQEAAKKKFKIPAAIAGSLAGTAVGVHGGEALGKFVAKRKKKTAAVKEQKPPTISGTIARGLGGLAAGTVGGYGAGKAVELIARKRGAPLHGAIPIIARVAGAGLGASYPLWKAYEVEGIRQALQHKNKTKGGK